MPTQSGNTTPAIAGTAGGADDGAIIEQSLLDPEYFAVVFRRHAPGIQRYVIARLGASTADDVVAETFLVAFRQRSKYQRDRPDARPWLYGIATNLIGRYRRAEIRQCRALARTSTDLVIEPFTDRVDAIVSAASARSRLWAALASVPAAQRDALLLVAWGDLTFEQAAEALGLRPGTVRSRVARARAQLRRALGGADPSGVQEEPGPGENLGCATRNNHERAREGQL